MRRRTLTLTLMSTLLVLAAPSVAAAKVFRVDVPAALARAIAVAQPQTDVPILLPSRLIADRRRLYGSGAGEPGSYAFSLASIRRCGGANACSVASFTAERGGELSFTDEVALAAGITGRFKGLSCGASCSPPIVEWLQDGILYSIQADAGTERTERRRMIALADSAIRNGPRQGA